MSGDLRGIFKVWERCIYHLGILEVLAPEFIHTSPRLFFSIVQHWRVRCWPFLKLKAEVKPEREGIAYEQGNVWEHIRERRSPRGSPSRLLFACASDSKVNLLAGWRGDETSNCRSPFLTANPRMLSSCSNGQNRQDFLFLWQVNYANLFVSSSAEHIENENFKISTLIFRRLTGGLVATVIT